MSTVGENSAQNILIIEDNSEDLALLYEILTDAGYVARPTNSARAGLSAALRLRPDLILLDIVLSDGDGFTLCTQILAQPEMKNLPIIFISGLGAINDKVRGFEVGGRDYMTKPFEPAEVLVRVRNQLELQALREQAGQLAQMEERQRIARELHDSVNQTLFILGATTESLQLSASEELPVATRQQLEQIHMLATSAQAEMRSLLYELRPEAVAHQSIDNLLEQLVRPYTGKTAIHFALTIVPPQVSVEPELKVALYRICQEAVSNAVRHGDPSRIHIRLIMTEEQGQLEIEDDGHGFDETTLHHNGMGLARMQQRATNAGVDLTIHSIIGNGTRINICWNQKSHSFPA